jgi:DHA2 family multidrug resistance protein-like MFS transporter
MSQVETGLLITPFPALIVITAPWAGRLADRHPAGVLGGAGLIGLAAGLGAMALLPTGAGPWDIVWRMALAGIGFGFFQAPNNRALMLAAPPARSGAASAMIAMCRVLGQAAGSASAAVALGLSAHGAGTALWVSVGLALTGAGLSLVRLASPPAALH